jgi:16S rRNA U1498 N3-methylase RsmE
VVVSLGPTILRTETAGVVATALAVYLRGGLGAGDE